MDKPRSVSRPDEKHRAELEAGDKHHSQRSLGVMTRRELEGEVIALRKQLAETQNKLLDPDHPALKLLKAERDESRAALAEKTAECERLNRDLAEAKKYGGEMAKAFHEAAYEDD